MSNGETTKRSNIWIIVSVVFIIAIVFLFILFFSSSSTETQPSKSLEVKSYTNKTLYAGKYFTFNSTIKNVYDVDLKNVEVWLESGYLFTYSNSPLSTQTKKTLGELKSNSILTYFLPNIKVENVQTNFKDVPIYFNIMYDFFATYNLTINSVRNDSLAKYGGIKNMGIFYKKVTSPILFEVDFNQDNFVYRGKNASFTIKLKNSYAGICNSTLSLDFYSRPEISCKVENKTYFGSFSTSINFKDSLNIPCNYSLNFLQAKEFDSTQISIKFGCKYFERKVFMFDIKP